MMLPKWFWSFVFSFLLFCGNIHNVMSNITYVIRKAGSDKFGSVHNATECHKYGGAFAAKGTECQCPYDESTFLHFKNSCISNYDFENKLKTQSVCPGGLLRRESEPYPVFDITNSSSSSLKYVKTFYSQCSIDNVHYLDESSGKLLKSASFGNFSLEKRAKTTVHLRWRPTSESTFLKGRVVILEFNKTCKVETKFPSSHFSKPCIIFKSLGTLTFSHQSTTLSSPHSVTSAPSTRSTLYGKSTVFPGIPPISPTSSQNHTNKKTKKATSKHGVIVGSVVIVLGVVLLVLIVVLIYRKLKQKSRQIGTATHNSRDELVDDFDVGANPCSNGSQTSNQNGAEEIYMNTIPDLPSNPARISTNAHGSSQTVELQEPAELYVSMKDDVFQYDYASVNGGPGSNQNRPAKEMQQRSIPDAFEYDYASVNEDPRSHQNIPKGMQQISIPGAFVYDYAAMDGDLRFNNRTTGMCQRSIPVRGTHSKEDICTPSYNEPNEYINKKDEPEDGPSSEPVYQPLQIKSPKDDVYQSLDKTSSCQCYVNVDNLTG